MAVDAAVLVAGKSHECDNRLPRNNSTMSPRCAVCLIRNLFLLLETKQKIIINYFSILVSVKEINVYLSWWRRRFTPLGVMPTRTAAVPVR